MIFHKEKIIQQNDLQNDIQHDLGEWKKRMEKTMKNKRQFILKM